jgi:hypothetical protein
MKSQQLLIPSLLTSAVLLALVLIAMPNRTPARADGVNVGRDMTLVTIPVATSGIAVDDYLAVVDNRTGDSVIYQINNRGLEAINAQRGRATFSSVRP